MQMKSKSIRDSNRFDMGDRTCLAGKKESGTTALPGAIYPLNPIDESMVEGRSSIVPAQAFPDIAVIGMEMDRTHLIAAWPECARYPNLDLASDTAFRTPSIPKGGPGPSATGAGGLIPTHEVS